jgi:hypothetical protein
VTLPASRGLARQEDATPGCEEPRPSPNREDQRELLALFERLGGELAPRQRSILALHVRGLKRPRLARELGVSERIVKRELERILSRARTLLVARCGGGCDASTQLVWRFAFGLASAGEAAQAQLHLLSCPTCQAFLCRLGWWREAAAAAVPVPAVHQLEPNPAEQVLHALAERAGDLKHHLANGTSSLRQHTADAATQLKQHSQAAYTRALDPIPLTGLRPGAAATVVAGCLALGGGGVYCVQTGVNPVQSLAGITESQPAQQPQREPASAHPPEPVESAPPVDAPQAPVEAAPTPTAEPPPQPEPPPLEPPAPAPQPTPAPVEFGEPASAPPAPPVQAQVSSQPAQPAPAPAGGSDFGP